MVNTKEKILLTALHLFAKDGYEAVSVSQIAGELGMTKGALYKHYRNKRDIFDSILERMYRIDAQRAEEFDVPVKTYEEEPASYRNLSPESIRDFTLAQYRFWTGDSFAADFRKMLTVEQYRNDEMAQWYRNCLTVGPVAYMADIFREMMKNGVLKQGDPEQLAVGYYAPMYYWVTVSDGSDDRTAVTALNDHIDRFFRLNLTDDGGKEQT